MNKIAFIAALLLAFPAIQACDSDNDDAAPAGPAATSDAATGSDTTTAGDTTTAEDTGAPATTDQLTVTNCPESFGDGVDAFYTTYFGCVDVTASAEGTSVATDGLPPHPSPYYPPTDPNYVEFDTRGGTHSKNPGELAALDYEMTVPTNPVAKGITIDASMVDNTMNTSDDEYSAGPVGVALNGVAIFAAMAGPGDELAEEAFTFDLYEGHPAGTNYHYHFETPGPLEVLVDRGLSDTSDPGEGTVEIYGIMCDGTVVLGCTELDGSVPDDSDFDAQNGHIHDITDGTTTYFENRYHVHVCPGLWPDYPFFPEIAYYETTDCPQPGGGAGGPGGGNGPPGGGPPPN